MNTTPSGVFLQSILDTMPQQVAVIDPQGVIKWVNKAWQSFSADNGGVKGQSWIGVNYLDACRASDADGLNDSDVVSRGIERVLSGILPSFYFEYPCNSETETRWFMMRICPMEGDGPPHFVLTHHNITEHKLAECRAEELATLDSLTELANRRRLDTFLDNQIRRAVRFGKPLSLMLIDIDFFKAFNDTHGHLAGDRCLQQIAEALKPLARRPDDLVARYGGEEFALFYGDLSQELAFKFAENARIRIADLKIAHKHSTISDVLTASVGVATVYPTRHNTITPLDLLQAADTALYQAKDLGRNQVCIYGDRPLADAPPSRIAAR